MKTKLIFMILLGAVPLSAFAGGWTVQNSKIETVRYETNFLLIKVSGGIYTLHDGCDTPNEVVLEDETVRGDRQLSLILSAMMAGKDVSFYTANCTNKWNRDYPKIWSVKIHN